MTKKEQEILISIISNLKENPHSVELNREQRFLVIEQILYQVHDFMCKKLHEKYKGWICGTGLSRRIERAVHAVSFKIDDIQTLALAFRMGILKDDVLWSTLKEIHNVSDDEIEKTLSMVVEKCPRPSFHRSIETD